MSDLVNITYCGLYCKVCSIKSRVPQTATSLRDMLDKDGWPLWGESVMPDFATFWSVLNKLADLDKTSPDCRSGCGNPDCEIRKCAVERNIDLCPRCDGYPCEHINALAKKYPNLIGDGERLVEIGLDAWIAEQEERRATGFCYSDIRYPERNDEQ